MYFSFTFVLLFSAINPFRQRRIFSLTSFSLNKTPFTVHKYVWRGSRIYRKNGYLFFVLYPPHLRPRLRPRPGRIHRSECMNHMLSVIVYEYIYEMLVVIYCEYCTIIIVWLPEWGRLKVLTVGVLFL